VHLVGLTIETDPNINPELQLVSSTDCTTWFRLCPLISFVEIRDAIFTRRCLDYGEHWWDTKWISYFLLNHWHSLMVRNQQALEPENVINDKDSCSRRTQQTAIWPTRNAAASSLLLVIIQSPATCCRTRLSRQFIFWQRPSRCMVTKLYNVIHFVYTQLYITMLIYSCV